MVVVRGRLRLYSTSGFFLLLGLVILAIGIGMATLGYWPHGKTMPSAKTQTGGGYKTTIVGGAKMSASGEGDIIKTGSTEANSSTSEDVQGKSQFP